MQIQRLRWATITAGPNSTATSTDSCSVGTGKSSVSARTIVPFFSSDFPGKTSIDAPVGADIQTILARYQGLEVAESTHSFASKNWLAGVTAKPVKPIVTFSAHYPHDGIGMPICCGHDCRAFAPQGRTPSCRQGGWRSCGNVQNGQPILLIRPWATCPLSLKSDKAGMKTADLCRKHGISEPRFLQLKGKIRWVGGLRSQRNEELCNFVSTKIILRGVAKFCFLHQKFQ
jgi:hypothetical protein